MLLLSSADSCSKNSFRNTIRVLNRLDPDQDGGSVGLDLGPNCLHQQETNIIISICGRQSFRSA